MSRDRLGARVLGWSFVLLGAAHLATLAAEGLGSASTPAHTALDELGTVAVPMPGPHRSLADLYWGSSILMGVTVVAFGVAVLVGARRGGLRPLLWVGAVVSALGLVVSVLLMPVPPIIGLGIALIGAVVGLSEVGDGTPHRPVAVPSVDRRSRPTARP